MYCLSINKNKKRVYLSSPTMHGEELLYVNEAYNTNWVSTIGENIDKIENEISNYIGKGFGIGLSCGTAALHLALKLAGIKEGDHVFCSDMTFSATANPIVYEGGLPIFIDCDKDSWNMDPRALEKAFGLYPNVRVVVVAHLYGTPAKICEIKKICDRHKAILIEDAAESFGATRDGKQTGSFGKYSIISFNGNKIITGSSGGMLFTDNEEDALKAKKWSTQSRENAPWYQHEVIGYNYRLSNVLAGLIRGQLIHLSEHIERKKEIYFRYKEGFKDLPIKMNPFDALKDAPNYWLSCLVIDDKAMCKQIRGEKEVTYNSEHGKTCPSEIFDVLAKHNIESRPIWKPMHMQPLYINSVSIKVNEKYVDEDIFERGLCLPSDIKMTNEEQDFIINIIRHCFD